MSAIKPNGIVKNFVETSSLVNNNQTNKPKESSAWIKPVVYTALGAAGVAAASFVLYRSFFSSSLDPVGSSATPPLFSSVPSFIPTPSIVPTPTEDASSIGVTFDPAPAPTPESSIVPTPTPSKVPTPTSTSMEDESSVGLTFDPPPMPTPESSIVTTPTPSEVSTSISTSTGLTPTPSPISTSDFLKPLERGATWEEYQRRGNDLLKHFQYDPESIDLDGIWKKATEGLPVKKNLSTQETRELYDNCTDQISKFLPQIENPMDRTVFVISKQFHSGCKVYARNAMKDQFWAQKMLFPGDVINEKGADKKIFLYNVGLHGTTNSSETATNIVDQRMLWYPPVVDWPEMDFVEPWVDSLGEFVGDNRIGNAINQYPLSSPVMSVGSTIVFTPVAISMLSSMNKSFGHLMWTIPVSLIGGYFVPHVMMSPPSFSDVGNGLSFLKDVATTRIDKLPGLLVAADEQISETGKQIGQQLGDNAVGHAFENAPKTAVVGTLTGTGALGGTAYGSVKTIQKWTAVKRDAVQAAARILVPQDGSAIPSIQRLVDGGKQRKWAKENIVRIQNEWHGNLAAAKKIAYDGAMATFTVGTGLYLIGGSAAVGAVAVPVVAGGAYGLYSLYSYFNTPATNSPNLIASADTLS